MAELKNQRTIAPEAHSMHLTPDTDPASTFRLRNMSLRPRLDQLQFNMSSPHGSTQVAHPCLRLPPCPAPPLQDKHAMTVSLSMWCAVFAGTLMSLFAWPLWWVAMQACSEHMCHVPLCSRCAAETALVAA